MTLRIGHGVDVHRLAAGRPLMLGCVRVPADEGLQGHSDGDVVAHALCDAVLGAAGLGDLGTHFPSADEAWRGAAGADLLSRVADLLRPSGLRLVSAHVVAVAERPRLADHLGSMGVACAAALGVDAAAVRVTATTSDGLGFTGRGEGIAASAVALLDDVT